MKSVSIDGQVLHGRDRYGSWVTNALEGWRGPGPRSAGHSSAAGARTLTPGLITPEARQITISGRLAARDETQAEGARTALEGLLREPGRMLVDSRGQASYRTVRDLELEDPILRGSFLRWQMTVTALDARRYGPWQAPVLLEDDVRTPGVFHRGNADSPPVLRVTGTAPTGYVISHEDGRYFEVYAPLAAGEEHVVDFTTGRAYRNGVPLVDYGRARTILIHPGPSQAMRIRSTGSGGNVSATVETQDVWV